MAKNKQQKKKDREKRVAKQKLADAARRREVQKKADDTPAGEPRAKKVITAGVKQSTKPQAQVQNVKPAVVNRRSGG
ncbi:MAG: hypothetical protein RIK87_10585 [Fuerstiella sp.]